MKIITVCNELIHEIIFRVYGLKCEFSFYHMNADARWLLGFSFGFTRGFAKGFHASFQAFGHVLGFGSQEMDVFSNKSANRVIDCDQDITKLGESWRYGPVLRNIQNPYLWIRLVYDANISTGLICMAYVSDSPFWEEASQQEIEAHIQLCNDTTTCYTNGRVQDPTPSWNHVRLCDFEKYLKN